MPGLLQRQLQANPTSMSSCVLHSLHGRHATITAYTALYVGEMLLCKPIVVSRGLALRVIGR